MFKKSISLAQNVPLTPYFKALCACTCSQHFCAIFLVVNIA